MTLENPEQQPSYQEIPAEKEQEQELRTSFETKEGEKFFAEKLVSPEDPRVEKVQDMLEDNFSKEEVDPVEVMKESMTGRMETGEEVPPYLIHVAENSKGEVVGLNASAVVETVDAKGKESEKSGVWLGCYDLVNREERGKGVREELFKISEKAAEKDAGERDLEIKGFITEVSGSEESFFNSVEAKRAYIKTKEGFRELPYEQPPVDWNTKTGKPAEDAGMVPEHLMLKMASDKDRLSGKELMEMVRGMYLYNNYREEEYFKNEKAYQKHTGFVKGTEQKLTDFIGRKQVHLLSREEREAMMNKGIKFINHREKEDKAEERAAKRAEKAEQKKGWKEYFGPLAEMQLAMEKAERAAKKEKAAVESAKIPERPIQPEQVLKEVGIEKPAESFEEYQKKLEEWLKKPRPWAREQWTAADKFEQTRDAYCMELDYSVRYKGLLSDKIEILDETGKSLKEFKSFNFGKTERQVNDFLKDKLKEKLDGKPAENITEEEKLEKGLQKAVRHAENRQREREQKISSLADVKKVGRERIEKVIDGLSYVAALDKLGILGLKEGKKLAVEGGKDLMTVGLTPAAALEETGREVAGRFQVWDATMKKITAEGRIKALEELPQEERPDYYSGLFESLKDTSEKGTKEMVKGYDKIYKKGKILEFLKKQGGLLGKGLFGRAME